MKGWLSRSKPLLFYLPLFLGLVFIGTRIDTDDWFLLTCGRYVESFGIPHVEPFTMHEGWHYVMQQWLFALGLWKLYASFGLMGLVAYAWAGGVAVLFLYDRLVHLAAGGKDSRVAEFLLVLPLGCLLSVTFFVPRPQILSMLFCLVEVYLLERYHRAQLRWMFMLLPLMSAVLINVHAAIWPMFLVLILPYLAESLFGKRLTRYLPHDSAWRTKDLLLLFALCFAAGFLNPYGIDAMRYSALSSGISEIRWSVTEMKPLSLGPEVGIGGGSLLFLLYFALAVIYARHPVPLRHVLFAAGTGFMGLLSLRSLFFFWLFATFPLGRVLAGRRVPRTSWPIRRKLLVAALVLANVVLFASKVLPIRYQEPPFPAPCVAGVEELSRIAAAEGKAPQEMCVYTDFIVGGFAEFHGFRAYLDGRAEAFAAAQNREADVFQEYLGMQHGRIPYQDVLDAYRFDALLVRRGDILWTYLPLDEAYECVWDSQAAGITGKAADDMRIYRKAGNVLPK